MVITPSPCSFLLRFASNRAAFVGVEPSRVRAFSGGLFFPLKTCLALIEDPFRSLTALYHETKTETKIIYIG